MQGHYLVRSYTHNFVIYSSDPKFSILSRRDIYLPISKIQKMYNLGKREQQQGCPGSNSRFVLLTLKIKVIKPPKQSKLVFELQLKNNSLH